MYHVGNLEYLRTLTSENFVQIIQQGFFWILVSKFYSGLQVHWHTELCKARPDATHTLGH